MELSEWIDAYRSAWEERDPEAAARLFSEAATYRSNIYEDPHVARDGVRRYWEEVTRDQSDIKVQMGTPIQDGDRATVEWWTTMRVSGAPLTLAGCLLLDFDESGLCTALREYWQIKDEIAAPPSGWGR